MVWSGNPETWAIGNVFWQLQVFWEVLREVGSFFFFFFFNVRLRLTIYISISWIDHTCFCAYGCLAETAIRHASLVLLWDKRKQLVYSYRQLSFPNAYCQLQFVFHVGKSPILNPLSQPIAIFFKLSINHPCPLAIFVANFSFL